MNVQSWALKPNRELRAMARARLKGNWGMAILACFLFSVVAGVAGGIPYLGAVISLLVSGPLTYGIYCYFLKFVRNQNPQLENLFDGFKLFMPAFLLYLLYAVFTFLWTLLFIVPGIIAALRYALSFYILNDNPDMKAMDAINLSKQMMNGQKGKLFMLGLSFIGWGLICILTLGIGFLWLFPYMQTSMAYFYEDVKNAWSAQNNQPASEESATVN